MTRRNIIRVGHFCIGIALVVSTYCCLSLVSSNWVAKAKVVSGGIWAKELMTVVIFQSWQN